MRVSGALWALDAKLAYSRHYPSCNWNLSYSLYFKELEPWFRQNAPAGWGERRQQAVDLLQRDTELQEIVQLVGPDALQDQERLLLEFARMLKESFLQQNAYSDDDAYSSLEKTGHLLDALLSFYEACSGALKSGVLLSTLLAHPSREQIARLRELNPNGFAEKKKKIVEDMLAAIEGLKQAAAA
jgi:V/A-type H+-transporting ATPase subunit A